MGLKKQIVQPLRRTAPHPMTIAILLGTRPNFIKAAPLWRALREHPEVVVHLIHTGQHRDKAMSAVFFRDLDLPEPTTILRGDQASPVRETAQIALELEPVLDALRPDWVVVIGDVTSTLAGALAAKQLGLRVAHVEAGLRSGDRRMPEERNRIAVDHLSDLLFASEESGAENLLREGIPAERVHFVGNVLIDMLRTILPQAKKMDWRDVLAAHQTPAAQAYGGEQGARHAYALCTFHRIANVDASADLARMLDVVLRVSRHLPVVFPVHPRTVQKLREHRLFEQLAQTPGISLLPPVGYVEMVCLLQHAQFVLTDSGGVQEETTWLGVPCFTFRENTERPATVTCGTNTIISDLDPETAERQIELLLAGNFKCGTLPPLWDGHAATRIADILLAS